MKMTIIGQMFDKVFLLDIGDDQGQILDLKKGLLLPPAHMSTLTSQAGPWDDYTGSQDRLADLLARVKPAPPPPPAPPGRTHDEKMKLIEELRAKRKAQQ